jgi:NADPH-dependent curcumin reductase CurA
MSHTEPITRCARFTPEGQLTPRLPDRTAPAPSRDGEVLLDAVPSLDPYMRAMMNEIAPVYSRSIAIGEVMAERPSIASSRLAIRVSARVTSCSATPDGKNLL